MRKVIQERNKELRQSLVVECTACDEKVQCDRWTNTCVCGADYDFNGHRLAPREQWGEETGEHFS